MSPAISIFGLGYVGTVSAACLAKLGYKVIGVDVNPQKVEAINQGRSPIVERDINELICDMVARGQLRATSDATEAILNSEVSMICVGTPSNGNGSLNLDFVKRVAQDIGKALAQKKAYHTIILRSTVLPGTTDTMVIPVLEESSGLKVGKDFGVCFNPEFLREGTSVEDFFHPPFTVIGQHDAKAVEVAFSLYGALEAPVITVPLRTAEMVKYANNAFHALKVTFANEIGSLCKKQGIDSQQVMDIFCRDTKLNLSPYYLKPGFAFGGSCLPKDLRAILYQSRHMDLNLPVLEAIMPSNEQQIRQGYEMIRETGSNKIGILGFSFKEGTDDLRESPLVILIEMLIGKGYEVRIYDRNVSLARIHGSNKEYIERVIPHIAALMRESMDEVIESSDVIVIGNRSAEFRPAIEHLDASKSVVDLVCLARDLPKLDAQYTGIAW